MGFRSSLSASGFVVLNVIRILNIIALLLVMVASMVMVVKTIMVSHFYFFDSITHIITFAVAAMVLVTEVNLFQGYISRNWPLFGIEHGFVTLGLFMLTMAVSVLGNLNKEATSVQELGSAFYDLVMAAGVLTFIMSITNLVANYMFRHIKFGVTARMVRAYGKQARQMLEDVTPAAREPIVGDQFDVESQRAPETVKYPASSFYGSRTPSTVSGRSTVCPPQGAAGYNISRPMAQTSHPAETPDLPQMPSAIHPALRGNAF